MGVAWGMIRQAATVQPVQLGELSRSPALDRQAVRLRLMKKYDVSKLEGCATQPATDRTSPQNYHDGEGIYDAELRKDCKAYQAYWMGLQK